MNYVIVRTRARDTLKLATAFKEFGIDGWTPEIEQRMRAPRKKKIVTLRRPALPTFLFVYAGDIDRSLELGERRIIPHHQQFVFNGEVVTVAGNELYHMRVIDLTDLRRDQPIQMPSIGEEVRVLRGPFVGYQGYVVGCDGPYSTVRLKNTTLDIKIDPFLLGPFNI